MEDPNIKDIKEFDMTSSELSSRMEELAAEKLNLTEKLMNIDVELTTLVSISIIKAMKHFNLIDKKES
jgi:hypothetical protein